MLGCLIRRNHRRRLNRRAGPPAHVRRLPRRPVCIRALRSKTLSPLAMLLRLVACRGREQQGPAARGAATAGAWQRPRRRGGRSHRAATAAKGHFAEWHGHSVAWRDQ